MRNHTTPLRRAYGLILMAGTLILPVRAADPIEEVGKTASEWVKTRAETSRLATAWTQDRQLLTSTTNGLKERTTQLTEKRDHLLAVTADERTEQANLAAKLTESRENLRATDARLLALTDRVLHLRPMLPPRLSEALEMSYRSLGNKEASSGERMQWVTTILNRCAQFNLSITQEEEVLTLAGEPGPKSVEVIYWGLSHAYALDRTTNKAWFGAPGASRWEWEPLAGTAPSIATLIAIRHDKDTPQLVTVPARLKAVTTQ